MRAFVVILSNRDHRPRFWSFPLITWSLFDDLEPLGTVRLHYTLPALPTQFFHLGFFRPWGDQFSMQYLVVHVLAPGHK